MIAFYRIKEVSVNDTCEDGQQGFYSLVGGLVPLQSVSSIEVMKSLGHDDLLRLVC